MWKPIQAQTVLGSVASLNVNPSSVSLSYLCRDNADQFNSKLQCAESVMSIFNAMELGNCRTRQARPAVVLMAATAILTLFSFSARTAEVSSKLMHDVETNPGPNCSGVSSFVESNSLYVSILSGCMPCCGQTWFPVWSSSREHQSGSS